MSATSHGSSVQGSTSTPWTWADQISTYRFWGLTSFYVCTLANRLLMSFGQFEYLEELDASQRMYQLRLLSSFVTISMVFGFWVAWAAVQWRTTLILLVMAVVEVAGVLLLASDIAAHTPARLCGAILVGLASGTVLVAVPAILAGGRGGSAALVVAFGIVLTLNWLTQALAPLGFTKAREISPSATLYLGIGLAVVGLLFLIPVRHALFNEPPPLRETQLEPQRRNPFLVALLCFVPVYNLFHVCHWMYRAHGEVASLSPSRGLVSPLAAMLIVLFVPLMPAILLTTLALELNRNAAERAARAYASPAAVFALAIFVWPVGMGIVQAAMNKAMKLTPNVAVES